MKIIWSEFSELQLDEIFTFQSEKASFIIAKKLIRSIIKEPNKLLKNPELGQVEETLLHRSTKYRYILHKNYKIIYSIDNKKELIKIADVFDTRQSPLKIERTIKV